jgi:hypothetical protein
MAHRPGEDATCMADYLEFLAASLSLSFVAEALYCLLIGELFRGGVMDLA